MLIIKGDTKEKALQIHVSLEKSDLSSLTVVIQNSNLNSTLYKILLPPVYKRWWFCTSGNALVSINVVAIRRAQLVLGWVTVCGQVNHLSI